MSNQLWIFTTPANALVQLTADNGVSVLGVPQTYEGRADAQLIEIPFDTEGMGASLRISFDGYNTFEGRAILMGVGGEAFLQMDDFHLTVSSSTPSPEPTPPPSYHGTPEEIIDQVYNQTHPDLSTHEGCGKFTEDCATALHNNSSQWWGHIKKNPGQNQYNGHAVDAIMLASGVGAGIWDIVHDSVSPSATPQYIYKGPPDLNLWYYPA